MWFDRGAWDGAVGKAIAIAASLGVALFLVALLSSDAWPRMHHPARGHRIVPGGGLFATAGLDFNFAGGSYSQPGTPACVSAATCLAVTRASTGYAADLAGNYTSFPANTARITDRGLLVEEARTNGIRNNSMQGAVAGSPGTMPTNWNNSTAGLTQTIALGTANGVDYMDVRFAGTTDATGAISINMEGAAIIAAAPAQVWTSSVFVALVAGSAANVTSWRLRLTPNSGAGFDNTLTPTGTLTRSAASNTLVDGGITSLRPTIVITFGVAVPIDFTLRIGWPQVELGSWATSPIRTTSAAATRVADNVLATTPLTFGSDYTLYGDGVPTSPTAYASHQHILQIRNAGGTSLMRLKKNATNAVSVLQVTGVADVTAAAVPQNVFSKIAGAHTSGSQGMSLNGGTPGTASTVATITPTVVEIGASNGSAWWNGYIGRAAVWPTTRLSNADLQAITAP